MNIRTLLGLRRTEGEVGIEIEVEGRNIPAPTSGYWKGVKDGSLRGNSLEYVLRHPVLREDVSKTLTALKRNWVSNGSVIRDTERAGIHVHINMQEENVLALGNFIVLYYLFETVLMKYCGKSREGNLFCLRLKDAEYSMDYLMECLASGRLRDLKTDHIRYASLNLKALPQYGSLEFRGMRSTSDLSKVKIWVKLLLGLKDLAKEFNRPSDIIRSMSCDGVSTLMERAFTTNLKHVLYEGCEEDVHNDMQLVQELAFCPHWANYEKRVA